MADLGIPATMCEAFQATVARYPDELALRTVGGAVTITWGDYAARVRQIAAGLAGLGVGRRDTVALIMTNRPEFHLVDTAAFHLGAIPFSVYNTFAAEQIAQVLANAGNRVVVCEEQFVPRLAEVTGDTAVEHVVCVDGQPAGAELAGRFRVRSQGVWEMRLKTPLRDLEAGTLTVAVKDRQGNVSHIERVFSVVSRDRTDR